jgi:hypothetical protein
MGGQVVDGVPEWTSYCCLDELAVELATEIATDALDQAVPALAERFRFGRRLADRPASREHPDRVLRRGHGFTRCGELVEPRQELGDSLRDFPRDSIALPDPRGELSFCFVHPLELGERFAFFDQPLLELADRTLGDRDTPCGLGFAAFEVDDCFMALAQPRVCPLELPLERGQGRTQLLRVR